MFSRNVIIILLTGLLFTAACNPFAPSYDEDGLSGQDVLGDRTTLDGLFEFFKNSYEIRDTSLYAKLFAEDFVFVYYDFDQGAEVSWNKGQELAASYNLFRSVKQITLDWNFYLEKTETDREASVVRSFNLNIVEADNAVISGTGRARMKMRRDTAGLPWKIYYWFDDSDF